MNQSQTYTNSRSILGEIGYSKVVLFGVYGELLEKPYGGFRLGLRDVNMARRLAVRWGYRRRSLRLTDSIEWSEQYLRGSGYG